MVEELSKFGTDKHLVTIVIQRIGGRAFHIGLIHKTRDGKSIKLLHFGDDKLVIDEELDDAKLWGKSGSYIIPLNFPEEDQVMLAMVCRQFKSRLIDADIRYGLLYKKETKLVSVEPNVGDVETYLVSQKLKLVLGEACSGLTCATFVLALFSHIEIDLVDIDNWPPPSTDDAQWFSSRIRHSESQGVEREQIEQLMAESIAAKRFRPTQVAASVNCGRRPAPFECIEVKAMELQNKL